MSFELAESEFELEIKGESLEKLSFHEEVVDSFLEDLVSSIKDEERIKDPVVVDEETGVVLDGTHRVVAVKELGYEKVPVCSIDYQDSRVKVGSWSRLFPNLSLDPMIRICEELEFEKDTCESEEIGSLLFDERFNLIIASKDECRLIVQDVDSIQSVYRSAVKIEEKLREEGFEPQYESEKEILGKLNSEKTALLIPPAHKEEIIKAALSESPFPYKATRHILPIRPLGINLPLPILEKTLSEIDEKLADRLGESEVEYIPPGSEFEGREYEEELIVFKQ